MGCIAIERWLSPVCEPFRGGTIAPQSQPDMNFGLQKMHGQWFCLYLTHYVDGLIHLQNPEGKTLLAAVGKRAKSFALHPMPGMQGGWGKLCFTWCGGG